MAVPAGDPLPKLTLPPLSLIYVAMTDACGSASANPGAHAVIYLIS